MLVIGTGSILKFCFMVVIGHIPSRLRYQSEWE